MSPSIRSKGAALVAVVGGAALALTALAGCTADTTPSPTKTPTATKSAAAAKPSIVDITDAPGSGEGLSGAKQDDKLTKCDPKGDGWTVAGTITNSGDDAADYRIYVSVLAKTGSSNLALKQVDVAGVAKGASQDWSADIPELTGKDLTCVLRTEKYAAK